MKCDGNTYYDGAVYVNVTGGVPAYSYAWRGPENYSSHNPDSITNLRSGNYYLTLKDVNMCQYIDTTWIPYPQQVTINPALSHYGDYNISCTGLSDGMILSNVSGTGNPNNYHYRWRDGSGNVVDTMKNLYSAPADIYNLYVIDSIGCYSAMNIPLQEPALLQIERTGTQYPGGFDISCFGLTDGIINLDLSGSHSYRQGKTYAWTKTGNPAFTASTKNIAGLDTGTYVIMVTDTFHCSATTGFTLEAPPEIRLTVVDSSDFNGFNVSCKSSDDGSYDLNVTGGYGEFSYVWNTADGHVNDPSSLDQPALLAGTYELRATDAISCYRDWSFHLSEPDTLAVNPETSDYHSFNISCFNGDDGHITLNPSGGVGPYTYHWTGDGTGLQSALEDQAGLGSGSYHVTLTDENQCVFTHDFQLTQPEALQSVIIPQTIACYAMNTGSADLTVTGGVGPYDYHWNNGAETEDLDSLYMGQYAVSITDANNCRIDDTTLITEPPEIVINLLSPQKFNGRMISCYGRSDADILTNVTGGVGTFRYNWLPGGETTPNLYDMPAGTYVLSVTDGNLCTIYDSVDVVQPQPLKTEIYASDPSCYGKDDGQITLIPQGGTPDYTIEWLETGETGQTSDSLLAGHYHLEIRDLNQCLLDTTAVVEQPDSLYIITEMTNPDCPDRYNGGIRVDARGGLPPYSFIWSDDSKGSYIEDLAAGTYVVYLYRWKSVHDQ